MSGNDNGMTVAEREILASTSRKQVWELQDSRAGLCKQWKIVLLLFCD